MRILTIGGQRYGKSELLRQILALAIEADVPVIAAAGWFALCECQVKEPGEAFRQWFTKHDIPSLVARYAR